MDVIYSKNTIYLYANQIQMMLNTTSNFVQCLIRNSLRPILINCSSSSLFDHILLGFSDRGTHQGILNVYSNLIESQWKSLTKLCLLKIKE